MIIGLTGSIAMGKSETAKMFRQLGFPVFDADQTVHDLYGKNGAAAVKLAKRFPDIIVDDQVDRQILSKKIARDPKVLTEVEKIVHPLVMQQRKQFIKECKQRGEKLVVLDIPLLLEGKNEALVDKIIVVSADGDIQKQRALARPGMTKEKLALILSRQMPDEEKRRKADYIISTDVSLQDTFNQVEALTKKLIEQHADEDI